MDALQTLAVAVDARGIATVALQRGDVLNAFDETMIAELTDVFTALGARDDVRAIVLRSDGRAFCAGADLQWMQRASANDAAANLRDAERFAAMMRALRQCPKPTVARVQGHAFGGGVGLCAACDIVIASDHARFAVSEARFGILPAVIGPYLVEAVGQRQARRPDRFAQVQFVRDKRVLDSLRQSYPAKTSYCARGRLRLRRDHAENQG